MDDLTIKMIHDECSEQHSVRVSQIVEILAKKMHEQDPSINETLLSDAAMYHDIGKAKISKEILNKPGKLTDEEFAIMKSHSMLGAELIQAVTNNKDDVVMQTAYEIARWHHERYDGHGYPDKLKGDNIPISAQITSVADVYDALTSERPYKKAFSSEKAVDMITHGECGCFNPAILNCLLACKNQLCFV